MNNKRWLFWLLVGLAFFLFLYLIRGILLPFVLGIFIAYILHPAVDHLEKHKVRRSFATLLVMGVFFLIIITLLLLIAPLIASQLSTLITNLPAYISNVQEHYGTRLEDWLGDLPPDYMKSAKSAVSDFSGSLFKMAGGFLTGLFLSGVAFINLVSLILITPIVTFYLLYDWNSIIAKLDALLPRGHVNTVRTQMTIINHTLAGFLRGQLNVCLLLGAYYAIGLTMAGLKFGIIIGLVTGLLVIFPYIGLALGTVVGVITAFFQFGGDFTHVAIVLAVFVSGQIIEANFVTPKLVGRKVGLHPVWIIFGMLAGAALFGFVGILLAVPVTAVVGVLIRFAVQNYLVSSYYKGEIESTQHITLPPA